MFQRVWASSCFFLFSVSLTPRICSLKWSWYLFTLIRHNCNKNEKIPSPTTVLISLLQGIPRKASSVDQAIHVFDQFGTLGFSMSISLSLIAPFKINYFVRKHIFPFSRNYQTLSLNFQLICNDCNKFSWLDPNWLWLWLTVCDNWLYPAHNSL